METAALKTHVIDRTGWKPGPWDQEPDRLDFEWAGLPCFLLRNRLGNWCGYVGLASAHPLYGQDYGLPDVDVHGGLTYANKCSPPICHTPKEGEPDDVWWFGFDTGHAWDYSPGMAATLDRIYQENAEARFDLFRGEEYRDLAYTKGECCRLAEQLARVPYETHEAQ